MDSEPVREVGLAPALAAPALRLVLDSETQGAFSQDLPGAPVPPRLCNIVCMCALAALCWPEALCGQASRKAASWQSVWQPEDPVPWEFLFLVPPG